MEWQILIAAFINTVAVLGLVQLIKTVIIPSLNTMAPWLLPILAAALGPAVALVQNALSAWLGVPIDLSLLASIATGASAVALHQTTKQGSKAIARAARNL